MHLFMSDNIHMKALEHGVDIALVQRLSVHTAVHHLRPMLSSSLCSVLWSRAGRPAKRLLGD